LKPARSSDEVQGESRHDDGGDSDPDQREHLRSPLAGLIKTSSGNHVGYPQGTSMPIRKKIVKRVPAVIKVTVSDAEKAALAKAAARASLPLATYVRVAALEKAQPRDE
jgi:hypothetical protein